MTFWEWLNRLGPGWPVLTERQWVTVGLFAVFMTMLFMAFDDPALWSVDLFKTVFQAVVITGLINMVLAFHFSANHGQTQSSENTGAAISLAREAQAREQERPTGTPGDPVHVEEERTPRR